MISVNLSDAQTQTEVNKNQYEPIEKGKCTFGHFEEVKWDITKDFVQIPLYSFTVFEVSPWINDKYLGSPCVLYSDHQAYLRGWIFFLNSFIVNYCILNTTAQPWSTSIQSTLSLWYFSFSGTRGWTGWKIISIVMIVAYVITATMSLIVLTLLLYSGKHWLSQNFPRIFGKGSKSFLASVSNQHYPKPNTVCHQQPPQWTVPLL